MMLICRVSNKFTMQGLGNQWSTTCRLEHLAIESLLTPEILIPFKGYLVYIFRKSQIISTLTGVRCPKLLWPGSGTHPPLECRAQVMGIQLELSELNVKEDVYKLHSITFGSQIDRVVNSHLSWIFGGGIKKK